MTEPTKVELLKTHSGHFDSDSLHFVGLRGDRTRHLSREALEAGLTALTKTPKDQGTVVLLVARGPQGERHVLDSALLTKRGGMPGDRWISGRHGTADQLATTQADTARLIANGQPLELHGDNLYLNLDLSAQNLPIGSLVQVGQALVRVTPKAHNGCKKWVQRFGLDAMQLNLNPKYQARNLRGIYFQVVEEGRVKVGDDIKVIRRGE